MYFSNKYDRNGQTWPHINPDLNALNPVAYTFAGLETINYYSGLTATTTYSLLPNIFQNGSGLKNFGWFTDPTVSAFTQTVVAETLDNFVVRVSAGTDCEYIISDTTLEKDKIYYFDTEAINGIKGCYQITEKNIIYSTNFVSPALLGGYDYCYQCSGVLLASPKNSIRSTNTLVFGYNNGNLDYINDMWTSSTFFSVVNQQGVTLTRYPAGNSTYWDWQNNTFATTTEYPNTPFKYIGTNTSPAMDLGYKISELITNGINNIWTVNDYFRGVQDQIDYLISAQTLFGTLDYIEIGQEYYLRPGIANNPDIDGFVNRFPIYSGVPYNQYAVEKVEWVFSAKTNFPSAKIAICGSDKQDDGFPNSRKNIWNDRLIQTLLSPTYNPSLTYPDAITLHSYFFTSASDFTNIETWIINSVNLEYNSLVNTINDFMSAWGVTSNLEFWITEFGLTDEYVQISGSWAHGLYLISIVFKMLEIGEITMLINNSLSSGRQYGMLFDRGNIFGAANTADVFDLSAGGLTLGVFNRTLNDSTEFDAINFGDSLNGLYGTIFTGTSSNYLIYSNVSNTSFTIDFTDILNGYSVNYYLIYDALPTLYVNKKDPSTSVKEFPNITSGYTMTNINKVVVAPFSLTYIEFT